MTIHNLKQRAGIQEQRGAEGDAILLAENLVRSLKRFRQLSEQGISKSLINESKRMKHQVAEMQLGSDAYRTMQLAGMFESDDQDDDNDNDKSADYGYETDKSGNEKGSNPG